MPTPAEIREWATANGITMRPRGPIPRAIRDQYAAATGDTTDTVPDDTEVLPETGPGGVAAASEVAPAPPKSTGGFLGKRKGAGAGRRSGPRQSAEGLLTAVWSGLAQGLARAGAVPTARVLMMQAPVAGVVLDRELRGTAADRLVQPFAKLANKGAAVGTLVALPLLVQVTTMRPELYPMLKPYMVEAMSKWCDVAGPEMERKLKQAEKRKTSLGFDPEEMVDSLFAPVEPEPDLAAA